MGENRHCRPATKKYQYFSHRECEFFPCHPGADPENFNCLFCWCPLYTLGSRCGGNFRYNERGIKDCTNCLFPHLRENYPEITSRWQDIVSAMKKQR
ncbi:MAG: cysteine-rich small domain-containing protein [Eubacterium sp.]